VFTFLKAYAGTYTHPKQGALKGLYILLKAEVKGEIKCYKLTFLQIGRTYVYDPGNPAPKPIANINDKPLLGITDPATGYFIDPTSGGKPVMQYPNVWPGGPGFLPGPPELMDGPGISANTTRTMTGFDFYTFVFAQENPDKDGAGKPATAYKGKVIAWLHWGYVIKKDGTIAFGFPSGTRFVDKPEVGTGDKLPDVLAGALAAWNGAASKPGSLPEASIELTNPK
jgi:hypothetical protein